MPPLQGAWVRSLVGKLRFHKLHGTPLPSPSQKKRSRHQLREHQYPQKINDDALVNGELRRFLLILVHAVASFWVAAYFQVLLVAALNGSRWSRVHHQRLLILQSKGCSLFFSSDPATWLTDSRLS